MKREDKMSKKILLLCTVFIFVLIAYQTVNKIKPSGSVESVSEFNAKYILSQHAYKSSVLVNVGRDGSIIDYEELPVETGIEHSFLKQLGNKVYFDGYIAKTPSIYDYELKQTLSLPNLNKIYEVINPFSQYLFLTLNGGFSENSLYNSGACYLNGRWICKEFEDELAIRSGVVFNNKVFLYANTASPNMDENNHLLIDEKILVYDESFNLLHTYNVYDELGMKNSSIDFYQNGNKLFLFGTDTVTGEFAIYEIEDDLIIKQRLAFSETNPEIRDYCVPASRFSNDSNELLLEILCDKSPQASDYQSGLYQEDNMILKIDLNNLSNDNYEVFLYGDKRVVGVDFEENLILLEDRINNNESIEVDVYDMDFNKVGLTNIENFDGRTPTLIDISPAVIMKDSELGT